MNNNNDYFEMIPDDEARERGRLEDLRRAVTEAGDDWEREATARTALAVWCEDHGLHAEAEEQREAVRALAEEHGEDVEP